jgi:hypothetical protein
MKSEPFQGELYRADENKFSIKGSAKNNYRGYKIKYFTLKKNEVNNYIKHGKPYVKTWETTRKLNLLDILDLETRLELAEIIGPRSLNISFPVNENTVSRESSKNIQYHDDRVLTDICNKTDYDGYYMRSLNKNGRYVFHSEVGLCKKAIDTLVLKGINNESGRYPPRLKGKNKNNTKKKNFGSTSTKLNFFATI